MEEIFESNVRSRGDFAGVFEFDGETGYFYLYDTKSDLNKISASIRILTGTPEFSESDINIRWDSQEQKVGLIIKGVLWAVFDCGSDSKFGGNYSSNGVPSIPPEIANGFI